MLDQEENLLSEELLEKEATEELEPKPPQTEESIY